MEQTERLKLQTIEQKLQGTYYEALGLMQDANVKEIRSVCRKLALECHPDKFQRHADTAKVLFQQLQRIQDVLSDPQQRQEYDAKLEMQRHTSFAQRHMGRNEHP